MGRICFLIYSSLISRLISLWFLFIFQPQLCLADGFNGFSVSKTLMPKTEIFRGGPPKDGIPAIDKPKFLSPEKVDYLSQDDLILGFTIAGESRAYPLKILIWHENVNDVVNGVPVAVTYCPLCNSAMVFSRKIDGMVLEFGISGLLWKSNVLLYNRKHAKLSESLWGQADMQAVAGEAFSRKLKLKLLASQLTTWSDWLKRHPKTLVLSTDTGYKRNYLKPAYENYFAHDELMFPITDYKKVKRYKNKDQVVVIQKGSVWKAYVYSDVEKHLKGKDFFIDSVGNEKVKVILLEKAKSLRFESLNNPEELIPTAYMYWFSFKTMQQEVPLFSPLLKLR